ncbi:MAG: cytochrome C [Acidobacteriota bacterium]|nr:cytochrome C [Blastocatellia bacterium]MDW8413079.1 cytochrome C [Acidobacteriota bacterium]
MEKKLKVLVVLLLLLAFYVVNAQQHPSVKDEDKVMTVKLCDGETYVQLEGRLPNERLSRSEAEAVTNELMAKWLAKQPPAVAAAWTKEYQEGKKKAQQKAQAKAGDESVKQEKQTYEFTKRDIQMWERELKKLIDYGDQIFHDDQLIGSTNGVSCAMCHPNAANTHPETYPKYQIQLQRVALLRDMINWCIENPSRGKKLEPDDPKMRALEAYIMSQRKGVPMEYGKH